MMMLFVDRNKAEYGVEPVCRQVQIAPSSYYEHKRRERDPDRLPDRIKRDMKLELEKKLEIQVIKRGKKGWTTISDNFLICYCVFSLID